MDTIEVYGAVHHGNHCGNMGVYTHERYGTYSGEREGGKAHGFGVYKYSDGETCSGQLASGTWHGHSEYRCADGDVDYDLWERGKKVHSARVEADGACFYDNKPCGADHVGLVALKANAQPAAVRTCPPSRIPIPARKQTRNACVRFRTSSI